MNILLVNTNQMKPAIAPIGLDYLADALGAAGHEVRLLDLCFADDLAAEIARAFERFTPQVIGVTVRNTDDCYFSSQTFFLPGIKQIVELLRRHSDAPVVLGGVGFSIMPAAALAFCGGDFGIVGEGEGAFGQLLEALQAGAGFDRVPNLLYRNGKTIRQTQSVTVDLAGLPPRRRAFVDNARYFAKGGQAGFETKRGCAMGCLYCADPVSKGHAMRFLPPAAVVAELRTLLDQGIDHFHTCDSEFNLPAAHAKDVCRALIETGLGEKVRWFAYCAPVPFDDELAALCRRAGCAGIDFGADSGCDAILRRLGRHFRAEDLARTAALCQRHQLPFMYDLLLGGPGETRQTVRETIEFMRQVDADCVGLSLGLRVYDGTPAAKLIRAEGDPASNPNLYGAKRDNPDFLQPVFYLAPDLGLELTACVRELVAGDQRFFLPEDAGENRNYNYNDNQVLVDAIEGGARGAYWNILRGLRNKM